MNNCYSCWIYSRHFTQLVKSTKNKSILQINTPLCVLEDISLSCHHPGYNHTEVSAFNIQADAFLVQWPKKNETKTHQLVQTHSLSIPDVPWWGGELKGGSLLSFCSVCFSACPSARWALAPSVFPVGRTREEAEQTNTDRSRVELPNLN